MLMKVITTGNTTGNLIMDSNFKTPFVMLVVIWRFCLNVSNITLIIVKGIDYRSIIHDISRSDTIHLSENSLLDN